MEQFFGGNENCVNAKFELLLNHSHLIIMLIPLRHACLWLPENLNYRFIIVLQKCKSPKSQDLVALEMALI